MRLRHERWRLPAPTALTRGLDQLFCDNCSRMAGFSRVVVSWVMGSPLAMERSSRRMILPERVLGRLSPKRDRKSVV